MKTTGYIKVAAIFAFAATLALCAAFPRNASAALTAIANHDDIKVDFFYHGSEVTVRGFSDPGVDLVIKITSPESHQALKKKGKVGGFLWMNTGDLNLENVPNLYLMTATKKPEEILGQGEMDVSVIGFTALKKHVEMSPASGEEDRTRWFDEFVKFKENSDLYLVTSGNIKIEDKDGKKFYFTRFAWPYQAPPGDYTVTVYGIKDGKVVEKAEAKVLVEQVGTVKFLAGMAKNQGAIYGALSILAAIGAGFGVGLVFGKGGGAH